MKKQKQIRTEEQWWEWHDRDSARWSHAEEEAETRCQEWVEGRSDDGPEN